MQLHQQPDFQSLVEHVLEKAVYVCHDWGFDFQGYRPVMNTLWANVNQGSDVNLTHHHWGFTLQNFNLLSLQTEIWKDVETKSNLSVSHSALDLPHFKSEFFIVVKGIPSACISASGR
jgi:hypothetical protein